MYVDNWTFVFSGNFADPIYISLGTYIPAILYLPMSSIQSHNNVYIRSIIAFLYIIDCIILVAMRGVLFIMWLPKTISCIPQRKYLMLVCVVANQIYVYKIQYR